MSQGNPFNSSIAVSLAGTGFVPNTGTIVNIPAYQTVTVVTAAVAGNVAISLPNIPQLNMEYKVVNQSATSDFIMIYPSSFATGATRGSIAARGVTELCADATAAGKPTCFALSPGCYAKFVATVLPASGSGAAWQATEWTVGVEKLVNFAAAGARVMNVFDSGKTFLAPALTVAGQSITCPAAAATLIGWNITVLAVGTLGQILDIGVAGQANMAGVLAQAASTNAPVATVILTNNQSKINLTATAVASDIVRYMISSATTVTAYGQSCAAAGLTNTA